jgi:ABC-type cobalamin transport system permease subunit
MSQGLLSGAALAFGGAAVVVYFVVLAMRPRLVRLLNGSGLFFTGLGLIQASFWMRGAAPGAAWLNAELAIVALCIAVAAQSVSVLRNRKAWDGVDRRATVGERA